MSHECNKGTPCAVHYYTLAKQLLHLLRLVATHLQYFAPGFQNLEGLYNVELVVKGVDRSCLSFVSWAVQLGGAGGDKDGYYALDSCAWPQSYIDNLLRPFGTAASTSPRSGNVEAINVLLQHGADPSITLQAHGSCSECK